MWMGEFDWMLNQTDLKAVQLNNYLIFDTTEDHISFVQIKHRFQWTYYIISSTVQKLEELGHELLPKDNLAFSVDWKERRVDINRETLVNPGLMRGLLITRSNMAKYLYEISKQTYQGNVNFRMQQNLSEHEMTTMIKNVKAELEHYDITIDRQGRLIGDEINIRLLIFDFLWRMNCLLNINKIGDGYVVRTLYDSFENFYGQGGSNQKEMVMNAISVWVLRLKGRHFIDLEEVELYDIDFDQISQDMKDHLYDVKDIIKGFFPEMSECEAKQEIQYVWVSLVMLVSNENNIGLWKGTAIYKKIEHFQKMAMDAFKTIFEIEIEQKMCAQFFSITFVSVMNFLLYGQLNVSAKKRLSTDSKIKIKYPIANAFVMRILEKMAQELDMDVEQVELYLLDDYIGALLAVVDPKILPKVNVGVFFPENLGNAFILKDQISERFVGTVNVHTEADAADDVIITSRPLDGLNKMTTLIFDGLPNTKQINYINDVINRVYYKKFTHQLVKF
ncbi:MAG: helix-turn-helix domain-containing protein [Lactobacillaceae bacterium]|jgi:hypothetical protein|nr:helix-turn-helix domain-containing protein [Lactobacillaceae bacterium]